MWDHFQHLCQVGLGQLDNFVSQLFELHRQSSALGDRDDDTSPFVSGYAYGFSKIPVARYENSNVVGMSLGKPHHVQGDACIYALLFQLWSELEMFLEVFDAHAALLDGCTHRMLPSGLAFPQMCKPQLNPWNRGDRVEILALGSVLCVPWVISTVIPVGPQQFSRLSFKPRHESLGLGLKVGYASAERLSSASLEVTKVNESD